MSTNVLGAYKGDKPYIFVSYAHRDSERVFPLLKALQDAGYRIWFDHGIEVGTEWSNNIAAHLSKCSAFLFFASHNSVKSENCLDEVAYAKSHNKQALLAYLEEDVILPEGTDMQTARFQRMFVNRQPSIESFVESFASAAMFDACRDDGVEMPAVSSGEATEISVSKKEQTEKKPVSKKLLVGIGAAILSVLVIVLAVIFFVGSGDEAGIEGDDTLQQGENTSDESEVIELSDSLKDFTFRLGEKVYKLPVSFSDLTKDGWTIGSNDVNTEHYIGGQSKEYVSLVNNGQRISVYVYNDIENAKQIKDCLVGHIEVSPYDCSDFYIAGELAPGSDESVFIDAYGTPGERNEHDDYVSLKWSYGDLSEVKILCYTDAEMAKYSSISITNYVLSTEIAEVDETVPSFLDNYQTPEALGDELYSGIISLDGDLYYIAAPLREFINNGWTITSGAGSVISGGNADIKLTKDGKSVEVSVVNLAAYKTIPENCIVSRIWFYAENEVDVILPGNISFGLSSAEVAELVPEDMEMYEGSYSISYSYWDYDDRDFSINMSVDIESDKLESISITDNISGVLVE